MNLQEAYKNWQENNPDEAELLLKKQGLKPRTIQLWNRKLQAYKNKKLRENIE